ncbi:hypothetical protein P389DRAFT_179736 [Cystobasidium minutum MCA 4210]|uniref:uncharacterized protein n=1 Tax=Cystobasidium minutum MCA 4210 TaxID=1397322 RepID=UPI0034CD5503|eukprot:jgi/Rhomi1/179736/fgenesh1_pg.4_\
MPKLQSMAILCDFTTWQSWVHGVIKLPTDTFTLLAAPVFLPAKRGLIECPASTCQAKLLLDGVSTACKNYSKGFLKAFLVSGPSSVVEQNGSAAVTILRESPAAIGSIDQVDQIWWPASVSGPGSRTLRNPSLAAVRRNNATASATKSPSSSIRHGGSKNDS